MRGDILKHFRNLNIMNTEKEGKEKAPHKHAYYWITLKVKYKYFRQHLEICYILNIACLYLGVVHDWGDGEVKVSVEKSFHTGCDVSTSTGLGGGDSKEKRGE